MQGLAELNTKILYGFHIRKDINEFYESKSEHWMQTEFVDNVTDCWNLQKKYIVKSKIDAGIDDDGCDNKNALVALLGAFLLSSTKRFMLKLVRETNGFYNNNVWYTDTESLYTERKWWNVLNKIKFDGNGEVEKTLVMWNLFSMDCFQLTN